MKKNLILLFLFAVLGITAFLVYSKSSSSTLAGQPLADFAIKDTASINKIIITDQLGKSAQLERIPGNKLWKLNNKYFAREDAVNLILKTINRISIRGNVGDAARENMMKLLVTSAKKIEIFTGGHQPAKIYYVGVATPDHTGTIMLLEIPGIGRSEEPYVTHIEGFTGFLSTRFFTNETEWRYTGIFEYPNLEFKRVRVIHHLMPASSFELLYAQNGMSLFDDYDPITQTFAHKEERFDTSAVQNFLIQFKKVHVESFLTNLKPAASDSIIKSFPVYTILVENNEGAINSIDLYLKKAATPSYDEAGNVNPWDLGYFWAKTMDNELAMAQTYNFGPLVNPVDAYLTKK